MHWLTYISNMAKRKFTAVFIGKDGSMDFVHGKTYTITVEKGIVTTVPKTDEKTLTCPYESPEAFLKNWDSVYETTESKSAQKLVLGADEQPYP